VVAAAACGGGSNSPVAPSVAAPVIRSLSVSPPGVGLESATQFSFLAETNASAPQSTFSWQFGDGSSASGSGSAAYVYTRSGSVTASLTVTNSAGQASTSVTLRVASLIGTWLGSVSGHTGFPRNRPIPISAFQLRLDQSPDSGPLFSSLAGLWIDSAGCRESRIGLIKGTVSHPRSVSVGVESLLCNDGDFYLNGLADEQINVITGSCVSGGPACEFRMVRQ
jgi:hypothetical protein